MANRKYLTLSLICLLAVIALLFVIGNSIGEQLNDTANDQDFDNGGSAAFAGLAITVVIITVYAFAFALSAVALLKLLGIIIGRTWYTVIMIIFDIALIAICVYLVTAGWISAMDKIELISYGAISLAAIFAFIFDIVAIKSY